MSEPAKILAVDDKPDFELLLAAARAEQTATAEILRLLSASPVDLQAIFDAIARSTARLCAADLGLVARLENGLFRLAATNAPSEREVAEVEALLPVLGEVVRDGKLVHRHDTETGPDPISHRTVLAVPAPRLGVPDVVLCLARRRAEPFSEHEVDLVRTFADQTTIALENARLLGELTRREEELRLSLDITERKRAEAEIRAARDAAESALKQRTATADILRVIAASPTEVQSVLEAVAKAAVRFCGTTDAMIQLRDGDSLVPCAHDGPLDYPAGSRRQFDRSSAGGRAAIDGQTIHIPDVDALDPVEFAIALRFARQHGVRAIVAAPLKREDTAIGAIVLRKVERGPFTPQQIQLLETFAAQAVIAIENVRLFTELRDALEQQTATADILRVIAGSPTDVQPVLDAVAKAAVRFCGAADSVINLRDGDEVVVAAHAGPLSVSLHHRRPFDRSSGGGRAISDGETVHIPDVSEVDPREFATTLSLAREHGYKASVATPLMREGVGIGAIILRKSEAGEFTPQQIQLLETFAAQAVIAIENVRLFTELRESLDQQTATADILKVIAGSPTDVQPVLDAVAKAAVRFCGAPDAMISLRDGDERVAVAHEGTLGFLAARFPLERGSGPGRAIVESRTIHLPDIEVLDPSEFAASRELAARHGFRASLNAPLLRDGVAIGSLGLRKPEPGPFSPQQIQLLETFAAQAVIAIENVRLFTELSDALEQQTATAEILRAISQSPTDVQPVLAAVTRAALRFCGAPDALVLLRDGDENVVAAHQGTLTATLGLRRPITGNFSGQALLEGRTLQIADVDELDAARYAGVLALARQHGWRASAAAPMMHGSKAIGCVVLRKPEPGLLSPRQIALLETFAAQAVIAIENVRLFTELRDALEQQTATAEILRVISQSPTDVSPVLAAVAKAALKFCGARDALVSLRDDDKWFIAAHEGPIEATRGPRRLTRGTAPGRVMVDGTVVHVPDLQSSQADDFPEAREFGAREGFRAVLAAPLLRDDVPIGAISLRRPEPGAFTSNQVELLKSFAAQAVIAIENVRLFTELRDALEQQTATAEILRVISQSPTDVSPVLTAVAKAALKFCGAQDAVVSLLDGDYWIIAAHEGPIDAIPGPRRLNRHTAPGRAMVDGTIVQIADLQSAEGDEYPDGRELGARSGFRSALAAPLLRDDVAIGAITLRRPEPGTFTSNQVELLKSFAAQAVIAIENVRLFTELRDSLERLKAAQANLIQSEKMASLGQLTAGIAHEIKNPLNFVNNFAALSVELLDELKEAAGSALATLDEDKRAEVDETIELLVGNLGKIAEHGKRADGIVKSMLSHSRGGSGDWTPSDINALVEEALNLAYHGARAQDNEFNVTLERDLEKTSQPIEVVPQDVTRVFLNLIGNGFYAVGKRRKADRQPGFRPTLKVSTRDLGEAVEVRVRDNGTGIPPNVREKLFQPFFTTKPTGEGTGLGLSISYDIVTQQHGGTIEVESEPGSFTEFTVRLPRRRVQASERAR